MTELKERAGVQTSGWRNKMQKLRPYKWTILWETEVKTCTEKGQRRQEDKMAKNGIYHARSMENHFGFG